MKTLVFIKRSSLALLSAVFVLALLPGCCGDSCFSPCGKKEKKEKPMKKKRSCGSCRRKKAAPMDKGNGY